MLHRLTIFASFAMLTDSAAGAQQPVPAAEQAPRAISHFREAPAGFSQHSGIADSLRLVIRDAVAWESYWAAIHRPFIPAPPVPVVDFAREMIVLAALGERRTAGYSIRIDTAATDSSGIVVLVQRTVPGAGCMLPAVVTQPVDLARVPTTPLPVTFVERIDQNDCAAGARHRP